MHHQIRSFDDLLCCFQPGKSPLQCIDHRLTTLAEKKTIKELLHDLETLIAKNPLLEEHCHPIVHAIGRRAAKLAPTIAEAFHDCDHQCQSGCYHGVIERIFTGEEQLQEENTHLTLEEMSPKIPTICSNLGTIDHRGEFYIQCTHGLGHAILFSIDYKLTDALHGCDLLPDTIGRGSCYLGVFMENVVAGDQSKRDLREDDPLYPCTAVAGRYRLECWKQQTKVMIHMEKSPSEIVALCAKAGKYQDVCIEGLGRDTSAGARGPDVEKTVKICEDHAGPFLDSCIGGAVRALVDFTWDPHYAYRYCEELSAPAARAACYRITQDHLRRYYEQDQKAIEDGCQTFAGNGSALCIVQSRLADAPITTSWSEWLLSLFR